jgi:catechol 2,3-dioxygenase
MPRTSAFLHDICGFELTGAMSDIGSAFYSNGNTHHDIGFIEVAGYNKVKAKNPALAAQATNRGSLPGFNHFGWEMESEKALVDAYQRALALGMKPRITNNGTAYSNYIVDDDGFQHQFYADNVLDWRTVYTGGEVSLHREATWVPGESPPSDQMLVNENPEIRRVERAILHPARVTHAVIGVRDLDRSTEFYREIAGLEYAHYDSASGIAYLRGSRSQYDVVLTQARNEREVGYHHASFELVDGEDVGEAVEALKAKGASIYADLDLPHKRAVVLQDENGLLYEFYRRRPGNLSRVGALAAPDRLSLL